MTQQHSCLHIPRHRPPIAPAVLGWGLGAAVFWLVILTWIKS